jgi:hypothetical protein
LAALRRQQRKVDLRDREAGGQRSIPGVSVLRRGGTDPGWPPLGD